MSKWVSHGYSPPDVAEARQAREVEEELLREYLPVILASSERILETPRYFYCQLTFAWLSSLWFFAGGPIPARNATYRADLQTCVLTIHVLLRRAGRLQFATIDHGLASSR